MERKLKTNLVWGHIDKTLGMFLIATRFKSCEDEWKIFKLMCNSQVEYPTEGIFDHPSFKKLVEKKKKVFLFESGEWNFDAIFSYLSDLEKEGVLYIGTPFGLIDEVLDKIPEDYLIEKYLSDELRILDPACGRGRFLLSMKRKLIDIGLAEKEAVECLYGIDIDPRSAFITASLMDPKDLCEKSNIYYADTLNNFPEELRDMKFDVIVGNPPFQVGDYNPQKLWKRFFKLSIDMLANKGYMGFITPATWSSPSSKDIFKYFKQYQCEYVDLDVSSYFPEITSTFTYHIFHKVESNHSTKLKYKNIEFSVDMKDTEFIPVIPTPESISIIRKLFKKPPLGVQFNSFCHSQRKDRVSPNKSKKFCWPVKHTATQILWSAEKHPVVDKKKVIFPISSAMKAEIDLNNKFGVTHLYAYIEIDNELEGIIISKYLHSKIISFLRVATNWSGRWADYILRHIPKFESVTTNFSDQEIYEYFGLTKEEIELIEETIKD